MLPPYRLLAKIVLATLWPISRHTEMPLECAQYMFALVTGVEIDFPLHVIDVLHMANTKKKELNLPFGSLITALAMKAKIPLRQNEPNLKMDGPFSAITVVKSEAIVTKRKSQTTESASSLLESRVYFPNTETAESTFPEA